MPSFAANRRHTAQLANLQKSSHLLLSSSACLIWRDGAEARLTFDLEPNLIVNFEHKQGVRIVMQDKCWEPMFSLLYNWVHACRRSAVCGRHVRRVTSKRAKPHLRCFNNPQSEQLTPLEPSSERGLRKNIQRTFLQPTRPQVAEDNKSLFTHFLQSPVTGVLVAHWSPQVDWRGIIISGFPSYQCTQFVKKKKKAKWGWKIKMID